MKKIVFLINFCLFVIIANAQFLPWKLPVKEGVWDYPIKPGMDEWKLQNYAGRINACQIPEEILYSLSTEELTDICLRYPAIGHFYAFNKTNDGLVKLFRDFNGIRELYKRKDAEVHLIQRYTELFQSLYCLDDTIPNFRKGLFVIQISVLEGLLSRIERQNNNEESLKGVLQALVIGYEEKLKHIDEFKGFGLETNFFSRANIIVKIDLSLIEQFPYKEKSAAFFSGMVGDEETVNIINELSYQLIK